MRTWGETTSAGKEAPTRFQTSSMRVSNRGPIFVLGSCLRFGNLSWSDGSDSTPMRDLEGKYFAVLLGHVRINSDDFHFADYRRAWARVFTAFQTGGDVTTGHLAKMICWYEGCLECLCVR